MAKLDPKEKNLLKFLLTWAVAPIMVTYYLLVRHFPGDPLKLFGLYSALYFVGWRMILQPLKLKFMTTFFPKKIRKYGAWAIVTGGTSGIGEAFVHRMGEEGLNVLIISRSEDKLKKTCKDFADSFPKLKATYLVYDFGTSDDKVTEAFYNKLQETLPTLTGGAGVLINNVGLANEDPEMLHCIPDRDIHQMLLVNNRGTVLMSKAVLPHMLTRKSGAIICISSASCTHPTPMLSVYSATKAFGNQLTRSMHYEYAEHGIDCLSLTPYYFVSNMFKRGRETYLAPYPQRIIDAALPLLGYADECYPYWFHWFMGCIASVYYDTGNGLLGIMKRNKARADAKKAKMAASSAAKNK